MNNWVKEVIGTDRALIGLCHFKALPGDPLYDADGGMEKVYEAAKLDIIALQEGGIDAIHFSNEFSVPYLTEVPFETISAMAFLIGELKRDLKVPFGCNVISDPKASVALASTTGAAFIRGTFTGAYSTNMGLVSAKGGELVRLRHNLGRDDLKLIYYVVPESAGDIGGRDPVEAMKASYFLDKPDALCVAGIVAGKKSDTELMRRVRKTFPEAIIFANTGITPDTIDEMFQVANAGFVGTYLKVDGVFENPVDAERVKRLMDKARNIREREGVAL